MASSDSDTTQRTIISPGPGRPEGQGACLIVIHGAGLGQRVDIGNGVTRIGRDRACELYIAHASVSRRHCEISHDGDRYRVRDLGSTNSTRLNDRVVEVADLADGDHLTIGESIVKFISGASVEAGYHEEVHQLATHDALTGFYNRRQFLEIVERELVRAARTRTPLAFAIVDIDLFKRINDTCGHLVGDSVLREVTSALRDRMRASDVAGRIGGEEFGLLVPELDAEASLAHMQALRVAVEQADFSFPGKTGPVTISIGLASFGGRFHDRATLMRAADLALYQAKQTGRNRVVVAEA